MINYKTIVLLSLMVLIRLNSAIAQSLSPNDVKFIDFTRRQQILGEDSLHQSSMLRPLREESPDMFTEINSPLGFISTHLIAPSLKTLYVHHHPYLPTSGALTRSAKLQFLASAGVYIESPFVHVQIRPEYHYAQNPRYKGFHDYDPSLRIPAMYEWWNRIDIPEYLGTDPISRFLPGQSFAKLRWKGVELGVSTETLWWGPGRYHSLLMTNTNDGFRHISLNTERPLKTAIGSWEGQVLMGKLEGSGYPPSVPLVVFQEVQYYIPKPNSVRYLNGFNLIYQPKWIPGLFLGFSYTTQQYKSRMKERQDYFPIVSSLVRRFRDESDAHILTDQHLSVSFRWVLPKAQSEIYAEVGTDRDRKRTSGTGDVRVFDGYVAGFSKLFPTKKAHIEFNVEVITLQRSPYYSVSNIDSWYIHDVVRQGYTHEGEILGSNVGPGGNEQTVSFTWVDDLRRIGLRFIRTEHNKDYYYMSFAGISTSDRHYWVDYAAALQWDWTFGNFLLGVDLTGIYTINYQYDVDPPHDIPFAPGTDIWHYSTGIDLIYRF